MTTATKEKPLLAYTVLEKGEDTGGIIFARSNIEARKRGSCEWSDGDIPLFPAVECIGQMPTLQSASLKRRRPSNKAGTLSAMAAACRSTATALKIKAWMFKASSADGQLDILLHRMQGPVR